MAYYNEDFIIIIADLKNSVNLRIFIISFLLLFCGVRSTFGQISVYVGSRQTTVSSNSEVPVAVEYPDGQNFSTVAFSKQYPGSKIPSGEISINFPKKLIAVDTIGILWYLKPESYSTRGEVNIVLVGIGPDSTKTFFIDNNNDRTFADNEESFVFKPDEQKRILEIKILGAYYNYTLMNPDYVVPKDSPSKIRYYNDGWRASSKKPSVMLDFALLTGGGDAELTIKPNIPNITSYQYVANIFGCFRPSAGIDFSWFNLHLGFSGSYEILQYESTVRYDYSDKFKTAKNFDLGWWTRTKLHGTISAEYDIRLFRLLCISPYVSYSFDTNIDHRRFEKSVQSPPDADYSDMYSKEAGFKIKIPTSEKGLVFLRTGFSRSWFDASDYLPEYEPGSYNVDYTQVYFGIGLQYRLTK
jgi:hypothetical protein